MTARSYVALGTNLGDRAAHLAWARDAIARLPETTIVAASAVEETVPIGPPGQEAYLNQMLAIHTALPPLPLLRAFQAIEHARGRERRERWGPRTLDIDIVLYGDLQLNTPELVVPHPELPRRDFWRRELAELGVAA